MHIMHNIVSVPFPLIFLCTPPFHFNIVSGIHSLLLLYIKYSTEDLLLSSNINYSHLLACLPHLLSSPTQLCPPKYKDKNRQEHSASLTVTEANVLTPLFSIP